MKKIFFVFAGIALALVSCNKEADQNVQTQENLASYSVVIGTSTKAVIAAGDDASHMDIKWADGDKIAFKLSDDSVVGATVTMDGTTAKVSVKVGANTITDAWFPYSAEKPSGVPDYQGANSVDVPLAMTGISGDTITFDEVTSDWAIVRVPVKAGINGEARTLVFVKFKNNNPAAPVQVIQKNCAYTLTDDVKYFDFVVPSVESTTEIIFRDSNGFEYRRKGAALTFASHKIYQLPTIADVDDTGKHIWFFGKDAATLNAAEAPLLYWWKQSGANNSTTVDTENVTQNDGYTTYKMNDKASAMTDFQAWVCAEFNKFYSTDGESRSNARSTLFPQYGTARGGGDYIPFVAVHTGNYPIFAIKMSNPVKYGASRKIRLQADTREALDGIAAMTYVDGVGNGDNKYSFLSGYDEEDVTVIYYDLSTANIGGKGILPNTQVIPVKTWQLRFYDVHYADAQATAPSFNMYWAGFFHNTAELAAFAAAN